MLKGKINFQELVSSGTTFEIDQNQDGYDEDEQEVTKEEYESEVVKYSNFNALGGFEDDDIYDSTQTFTSIDSKMTDIYENGDVKKRILRDGYGESPKEGSIVRVHYNAYTEFNDEPFDCTYARKRPHSFVIGAESVIAGLDVAVRSMKLNEKSQFLIKPNLAYGVQGCLDRIPPNSRVLFEIELLETIEGAAAEQFELLPEEKKSEFQHVYKYCISQCAKAKDKVKRDMLPQAIREYNIAAAALEKAQLQNFDEQTKQKELLYKLYSNLLICNSKMQQPKRGCSNFNKLKDLVKGTDLKITAKIYLHSARCLKMLGDYNLAKSRLKMALNVEPRNPILLKEAEIIDEEENNYKEKEKKMARALMSNS